MADTGSPHNLPYPTGPDAAYVHLDIKALAEQAAARLDNALARLAVVDNDSNWQALSLSAGFSAVSGQTPAYRILGQTVYLAGVAQFNSGSITTAIGTLPVAARPTRQQFLGGAVSGDGSFDYALVVLTTGGVTIPATYFNGTATAGELIPLFGSFLLG